ncbi:MAG: LysM peptidoglycan-binding domain-containing protein, partial [Syntrophomonadaceae bacterium]|nr:LysM peptidoglycan-binding domain-containing protein [Syntrophomonadaceae bacterium]
MSKRKGLFLLLQVLLVLVLVPAASAATTYTVRAGDSLWTIARRYHTTVEALKAANGLKSDALQIGDRLSIPAAASGATAAPAAGGSNGAGFTGSHTVRAGDSLWAIARRCNTTVAALKAANGLTSDALQIGDRLKVPAARVGAASAPAAAAPPPARPVVAPSRDAAGVGLARDIIATGMQYLGVDYDYGGASPSGFDCSGFIMYIC